MPVDRSSAPAEGLLAGHASCNRYTGAYTLTGEELRFSQAAVTQRACVDEALMRQENQFLEILRSVHRFSIEDDGALVLHAPDSQTITARR